MEGSVMNDHLISYDQPTKEPTQKVQAAGIGGAVTSLVIWLIASFTHVEMPAEVGAALATIFAFVFAYFTRDRKPIEVVELIQQK